MNPYKSLAIGFGVLVVVGGLGALLKGAQAPSKYDGFAQCIKDSGATFYGAFWCPHCQEQKKLFGSSAKLLPYVECSTADGGAQTQECKDEKIEGYPTWRFKDGSELSGEVEMSVLAEKTGCVLPE